MKCLRGTVLRALPLAALLLAALAPPTSAQTARTGWLSLVWRVAADPADPVFVHYLLTDDAGNVTQLELPPEVTTPYGGPRALDRRRVTVEGAEVQAFSPGRAAAETRLRVRNIRPLQPLPAPGPDGPRLSVSGAVQNGSKAYVIILCRFADSTSVTPHPAQHYSNMLTGTSSPGLDHYWREQSEGRIDLQGSRVVGWYDLPQPYSYYFPSGASSPAFDRMVNDCTGMADAEVDFSQVAGVNLQFNARLGGYSWGGGALHTRDGVNGVLPTTWMASWAGQSVYGHEMGHSFGLPHSSGAYTATYDSKWDVMSNAYIRPDATFVYIGQHTIAHHKDALGWIPPERKYVPTAGSRATIRLARGANPPADGSYQMIQVPIPNTNQWYTVEARRLTGYDTPLPGDAVVIHRIDPTRPDREAQVVDPDLNGNPNDAGAMWVPGESFTDPVVGLKVTVDSATIGGFALTVVRGYELALGVDGPGSVSGTGEFGAACTASCSRVFSALGSTVTLTATAGPGSEFLGWNGACTGKGTCSVTMSSNVAVSAAFAYPVAIASSATLTGTVGAAYSQQLSATGGSGTYNWSVTAGTLPPGLALSPGGVLGGTPTAEGEYAFTVRAVSGSLSASRPLTVRVVAAVEVTADAARPGGTMGAIYADSLTATGGAGAITWSILSGALPNGVELGANGGIHGFPTQAGNFAFRAQAASGNSTAARDFTVTVAKPVLDPNVVVEHLLAGQGLSADHARFLDLLGNRNGRVDVGDVRAWLVENGQVNPDKVPGLREIIGPDPLPAPRTPAPPAAEGRRP